MYGELIKNTVRLAENAADDASSQEDSENPENSKTTETNENTGDSESSGETNTNETTGDSESSEKSETSEDTDYTQNDKTYNAQIEINILSRDGNGIVGDNKLKIKDATQYSDDEIESAGNTEIDGEENKSSKLGINIFNINSGKEIEVSSDGEFNTNGQQGVIVDLSNLKKNKKYQIIIEELELVDGYTKALNNLKLDVEINNEDKIIAKISEVTDASGDTIESLHQALARLRKANENGTLTISPEEQDSDISIQYKIDENGDWQDYKGNVEIHSNTKIRAQAIRGEKTSEISLKVIDNIDNVEPGLESCEEENENHDREESITVVLTDDASGIAKYGISRNEEEEPDYIIADNELTEEDIAKNINRHPKLEIEAKIDGICQNGTYYIWILDSAGNCAKEEVEITKVEEVNVAKIVKAEGYEKLEGTEYKSLYDAIAACPEGSSATILLLDDIYNESNVIDNKDITLNLGGHKLNSRSKNKPTLTVNEESTLTVTNVDDEGVTKTDGLISSENTCAIYVKDSASFTLRSFR